VDIFFKIHDPTTINRQGLDVGTQYRSAIYYSTPAQQQVAQTHIEQLTGSKAFRRPIVTELTQAGPFYVAEQYHQRYLEKNPRAGCHIPYL